jgi:hypothetical protein
VGQTTFGQAKDEELVTETVDEEEAFSENRKPLTTKDTKDTEEEEGLPRYQNQRPFTAKDAEDAKEDKGLPLMNTDDTEFGESGGEESGGEVEFVPVTGGYEFERVRLRIEPELGGQRKPVQAVIASEERAEVHANLG